MANKGVGNTALGAAICRLIEQYEPPKTRLFDDPVVKNLVSRPIRVMMQIASIRNYTKKQTDAVMPGLYGAQVCRARYIDEAVIDGKSRGIKQLVILGAGLDTRPYRLPGMDQLAIYEIDLPDAQENKKKKLKSYLGQLPANVSYVPIDFDTQTLQDACAPTKFDPDLPSIFVCEGVSQYISAEAFGQTLSFIGKTAVGSRLVFTYVLKSIIDRHSTIPGADQMMERVAKNNAPWVFGLEKEGVPGFLNSYRLALVADVGNEDYQEKYLKPIGRSLPITEAERIALATVV